MFSGGNLPNWAVDDSEGEEDTVIQSRYERNWAEMAQGISPGSTGEASSGSPGALDSSIGMETRREELNACRSWLPLPQREGGMRRSKSTLRGSQDNGREEGKNSDSWPEGEWEIAVENQGKLGGSPGSAARDSGDSVSFEEPEDPKDRTWAPKSPVRVKEGKHPMDLRTRVPKSGST